MTKTLLTTPGRRRDVAWQICEYLPEGLISGLARCLPYVLPCFNLRIPVTIFEGPTLGNGGQGSVLAAGSEPYIHYLPSRFLKEVVKRERVGVFSIWELPRVIKDLQRSSDLTVVRLDKFSARVFSHRNYLAVPDWINSWLDVPGDLTSWSRAGDLYPGRLKEMSASVSHDQADLHRFYHDMYVPYIQRRHGALAYIRSLYQLRRCFGRGGILWLYYRGQPVAGCLFQHSANILRVIASATVGGEWPPFKSGTMDALKYFEVEYARNSGCVLIDFGGSRPSLHDGVLRYKRKWGVNVSGKLDNHYDWLIHWKTFDEKVISFLAHTSLIFHDKDGLSAITAVDRKDQATPADAARAHHLLWMPGLHRLYLIAPHGWLAGGTPPPHTVLLDSASARRVLSGQPLKSCL